MAAKAKFEACPIDGFIAQSVGGWAEEKHIRIAHYVNASRQARKKFAHNSSYIEVFCGAGRAKIHHSERFIDGSALVAWKESVNGGVPFGQVHVGDADAKSLLACERRLTDLGARVTRYHGRAIDTVKSIAENLSTNGLHLAVIDPYNLSSLHLAIIEELSHFSHIDLIIHFSTMDLLRNGGAYQLLNSGGFDDCMPGWREVIARGEKPSVFIPKLFSHWCQCVESLGLRINPESTVPIKNNRGATIYYLVHAAKHDLAHHLWSEVNTPHQNGLF